LLILCVFKREAVRLDSRVAIDNIAHWARRGCRVPNESAG
jgi:hypothetical protein